MPKSFEVTITRTRTVLVEGAADAAEAELLALEEERSTTAAAPQVDVRLLTSHAQVEKSRRMADAVSQPD